MNQLIQPSGSSSVLEQQLKIGLSTNYRNWGGGPAYFHSFVKESLIQRGHDVVEGSNKELYRKRGLDLLIGTETTFKGVPDRLREKCVVVDWGGLVQAMYFEMIKPEGLEGMRYVGYLSDEEHARMFLSDIDCDIGRYEDDGADPLSDIEDIMVNGNLVDFTLDDSSVYLLRNLRIAKKRNERLEVAVLFGGAPPKAISDFVEKTISVLFPLFGNNGIHFSFYTGEVRDEEIREIFSTLEDSEVMVFRRLPHEIYLHYVLSSNVVITKPGWLTVSESIYFGKINKECPAFIFLNDSYSLPEQFAGQLLRERGFTMLYGFAEHLTEKVGKILGDRNMVREQQELFRKRAKEQRVLNIIDMLLYGREVEIK